MKTTVIMPAYNAAATLERTIADLPFDWVDEVILVDDASVDATDEVARRIGRAHPRLYLEGEPVSGDRPLVVVRLSHNRGYGGNQKTCYELALKRGADIIVMVHPDYQYDPKLVKYFVEFIRAGYFDMMLGSRIRSRQEALMGGMPRYKYLANRMLSFVQNIASGRNLSEWHTGMRAYTRDVLTAIDFQSFSDDFIFDTQLLFAVVERGYRIGDIPVPVRYFEEASSINFSRSVRYGCLTLYETAKFVVRTWPQWWRYLIVGSTAAAMNLVVYAILLYGLQVWYIAASIIGFLSGVLISFTLHKLITFQTSAPVGREAILYILLLTGNLLINAGLLYVLVQQLSIDEFFGNVLAVALMATWNFFIFKHVVFQGRR